MCICSSFAIEAFLYAQSYVAVENPFSPYTYTRDDSHIHETWIIHICAPVSSYASTLNFFFFCDVTRLCVRHDSFIRTRWLNHTCNVTHSYMWHDAFIQVAWLVHTWEMTHSYMRHDAFIHVTWLIHIWAPSLARPPCLVLQLRFESRKGGRGGLAQRRAWGGELGCA